MFWAGVELDLSILVFPEPEPNLKPQIYYEEELLLDTLYVLKSGAGAGPTEKFIGSETLVL